MLLFRKIVHTYVNQSIAKSNAMSADGIPITCKTIPWTAIGTDPLIGGAASVAIVDDRLFKNNYYNINITG